jgi:transposase
MLIYLPAYSPELNPIEPAFAKREAIFAPTLLARSVTSGTLSDKAF